ncbi:MAG TPA: hypothetical protein VK933_13495, partial [Longimicrobiales bacterium]|nr:hypothetical protein [Longimicrobiales bacterium]
EMFSDFRQHVAGIPQMSPLLSNMDYDGEAGNEDFGLEQVTGNPSDRYAFRTSPLRNVALQPAFMHNGAFVHLEDAIRYHVDAVRGSAWFDTNELPADLQGAPGPIVPVIARLDPLLRTGVQLTPEELDALVAFVRDALLDPDARPERLRALIPHTLPSGMAGMTFQF